MNLRDYIESLNEFAAENPEYLDLKLALAYNDGDEWLEVDELGKKPIPCFYDKESNVYLDKDNFDYEFNGEEEFKPNVIFIN